MIKITKKYAAIVMCIIFLLSIASNSSAIILQQQQEEKNEELTKESIITSRTVTFYRYGPDESVTPVEVEIDLEEGLLRTADWIRKQSKQNNNVLSKVA